LFRLKFTCLFDKRLVRVFINYARPETRKAISPRINIARGVDGDPRKFSSQVSLTFFLLPFSCAIAFDLPRLSLVQRAISLLAKRTIHSRQEKNRETRCAPIHLSIAIYGCCAVTLILATCGPSLTPDSHRFAAALFPRSPVPARHKAALVTRQGKTTLIFVSPHFGEEQTMRKNAKRSETKKEREREREREI